MAGKDTLRLLTWNVRGLGTYKKRYRVLTYLKQHNIQVACLQETHLTDSEVTKITKKWSGQVYAATYSSYARGTLIWVAPGVTFRMTYVEADVEGRYVVL